MLYNKTFFGTVVGRVVFLRRVGRPISSRIRQTRIRTPHTKVARNAVKDARYMCKFLVEYTRLRLKISLALGAGPSKPRA